MKTETPQIDYWIRVGEESKGPISRKRLEAMWRWGDLDRGTPCAVAGAEEWSTVADVLATGPAARELYSEKFVGAAMVVGYASYVDPTSTSGLSSAEQAIHHIEVYVGVVSSL